ncbi:MAG: hypothetical protein ABIR25_07620 [Sphingomicrobium sp.]
MKMFLSPLTALASLAGGLNRCRAALRRSEAEERRMTPELEYAAPLA